jgi:hypothetical protein
VGSRSDSSLFILRTSTKVTNVLIYVDDILIINTKSKAVDSFLQLLHVDFAVKDFGPLHFFLGSGT